MINVLFKNALIGFIFGIIIAVIAFMGNFPLDSTVILLLPFIFGGLSSLGSFGAMLVIIFLSTRYLLKEKSLNIYGFIVATFINTVIAAFLVYTFPGALMHRELIVLYFVGIGMGAAYGIYRYRIDLLNERMQFLEELSKKNRLLEEASRELAITRERNRMGRELHDSISQGLHGLIFTIHSLRNIIENPTDDVTEVLSHMESTANSTLNELRSMIEELKPSILTEKGLQEALETTAVLFSQRHKIIVNIQIELSETIMPEVETTIYRITQEALANIAKHSGAGKVNLELSRDADNISLNIKDDGKGFNTKELSKGHGLKNMRHRAEEADGTIKIVSRPNLGTSITAIFPYKKA